MNDKPWWQDAELPEEVVEHGCVNYTIAETPLLRMLLEGAPGTLLHVASNGTLIVRDGETVENVIRAFMGQVAGTVGGREILHSGRLPGSVRRMFVSATGACEVAVGADEQRNCHLAAVTIDSGVMETLERIARERIEPDPPPSRSGKVYVVSNGGGGPELTVLGIAALPFIADNYTGDVVSGFEHVKADLLSPTPCGRVVIIEGPPGTGKTFLVRGLISAVQDEGDATFVVVPPELVRSLAGPSLIRMLIGHRENNDGALILLLEDADECLAPRRAENIGSVATLLAMGDGILGSLVDMRVLCTTNAKVHDFDEALVRPGRLCRHINVDPLEAWQARKIVERLLPEGEAPDFFMEIVTLAEVYARARKAGWQAQQQPSPSRLARRKRSGR